jgi:2,4-dichlorophenol 6-monooxygenase
MAARCDATAAAEAQREALRKAIAFKKYEFDCHGVEMNQRYASGAVVTDGQSNPPPTEDMELHYQPTTWPGARLPHVWVYDRSGRKHSTLDLCGKGSSPLDRDRRRGLGGGGKAGRQGAWMTIRTVSSARGGLRGPRRRLGAGARDRRFRLPAGAPRPARRLAQHRCRKDPQADLRRVLRHTGALTMTTMEQGFFTEATSAEVVISAQCAPRTRGWKEVMAVITRHLHEAVKEIEPTRRNGSRRSCS